MLFMKADENSLKFVGFLYCLSFTEEPLLVPAISNIIVKLSLIDYVITSQSQFLRDSQFQLDKLGNLHICKPKDTNEPYKSLYILLYR